MRSPLHRFLVLAVILAALRPCAGQTTLNANINVDNAFTAYLSTDDSVTGTAIGSGSNWAATSSFSAGLTPGVTNYLHVVVTDFGTPSGYLGSFSLTNANFSFVNGTQSLVTAPATWLLSTAGFGSGYGTPSSAGTNGVGPWGTMFSVDPSAQWLEFPGSSTAYFSTAITPVPEPAACAAVMGLAGLIVFGIRRLRGATRCSCGRSVQSGNR
jgi:hypothetical protein